jgi:branched-chain amino acid transport system ATP-binding protein
LGVPAPGMVEMTETALALTDVHTHIGQFHILQGVTFAIRTGGITALVGRNGAGKTTTLRTIMGLWKASRGTITVRDRSITALPTAEIARLGFGYVPENIGIFGQLTVRENMILAARSGNLDRDRLARLFGYFPPLEQFWNMSAGHLSGGQKQMLSIARAIIQPRQILLMDEPTKGVAPGIIDAIVEALRDCNREGTTILLVEQNYDVALALAEDVVLMDGGKVKYAGAMEAFQSDPKLGESALGFAAALDLNARPGSGRLVESI